MVTVWCLCVAIVLNSFFPSLCRYLYTILSDRVISQNAPPVLIACNKQDLTLCKGAPLIQKMLEKEMYVFALLYPPSPPISSWGVGYIGITLSVCPSVWVCPDDISRTARPFLTKLGVVVYYHEAVSYAQKLDWCLQCQGHSEGLHKQKNSIFTISSKLLVRLQPNLFW